MPDKVDDDDESSFRSMTRQFVVSRELKKKADEKDSIEIMHALDGLCYFERLDRLVKEDLIRKMYLRKYEDSHVIFEQGVESDELYVIKDGVIDIFTCCNLRMKKNKTCKNGDVIGAAEFICGHLNTMSSIVCVNCAYVWVLEKDAFETILRENFQTCTFPSKEDKKSVRIQSLLSITPLFKDTNKADILKLVQVAKLVHIEKGSIISSVDHWRENDKFFFILETGYAHIFFNSTFKGDLSRTEYFGELTFVDKNLPIFLKAISDMTVVEFEASIFNIALKPYHQVIFQEHKELEDDIDCITKITLYTSNGRILTSVENKNRDLKIFREILESNTIEKCDSDSDHIILRIVSLIGNGTFSEVCKVESIMNRKFYALKIMRKIDVYRYIQYIVQESAISATIISDFCTRKYLSFQDSNNLYQVLELMPSNILNQMKIINPHCLGYRCLGQKDNTKIQGLCENEVRFYAGCIILGLEYLHSCDIVYRDLKPGNVLLDDMGYARLSDFGFAKYVKRGERTFTFCGTVGFMAPEIIMGDGYDQTADFWSLGVTIFFMKNASLPFSVSEKGKNCQREILTQTCSSMYKMKQRKKNIRISDNLNDLLGQLFMRDPMKRIGAKGGIREIKDHPWFHELNWDLLKSRKYVAPNLNNKHFDEIHQSIHKVARKSTQDSQNDLRYGRKPSISTIGTIGSRVANNMFMNERFNDF